VQVLGDRDFFIIEVFEPGALRASGIDEQRRQILKRHSDQPLAGGQIGLGDIVGAKVNAKARASHPESFPERLRGEAPREIAILEAQSKRRADLKVGGSYIDQPCAKTS
jgi:hypothetical protein